MKLECAVSNIRVKRGLFSLVLDQLTLPIRENYKIPIMGVSGAGKSTVLNILSSMAWPEEGEGTAEVKWTFPTTETIRWDGAKRQLAPVMARKLRAHYFGFAFQSSSLLPYLNVMDNLMYPLLLQGEYPEEGVVRKPYKEIYKKAQEILGNVGLSDHADKFPRALSIGERQRVAMAQAIVHDPYVLFADEPTGNLDPETRKHVMDLLTQWADAKQGKRLLLWVTHHERDPQDNEINIRLHVMKSGNSSSICQWETWSEDSQTWNILPNAPQTGTM